MADPTVAGYAEALFAVAAAEGNPAAVEDELFQFAQALRSNDELRSTLADQGVPASRRQQVVEDLLDEKASATTSALVSMVVGAGRAAELPAIVDAMVQLGAASRNKAVATVAATAGAARAAFGLAAAVAAPALRALVLALARARAALALLRGCWTDRSRRAAASCSSGGSAARSGKPASRGF